LCRDPIPPMADVFLSYARSEKARVAPLVAVLEAKGLTVWWDPEMTPGQEFDQQIATELKAAAAVVVVWTPLSVASRWVRGEAREGAERGILVPVRFDGAELPFDARALQTTEFDDWGEDPDSPPAQELLRALEGLIRRPRLPRSEVAKSGDAPFVPRIGADRVTLGVLPFVNLSGDPEQTYFSDGITADIITELSRWRLLAVRSRLASFRFRDAGNDIKQVARELGVRFIVEGNVRRMGARIRVNVKLIDCESGSHIWAEKFDREASEIFSVQDQLVQTIVSTLVGRVQVSDADRARRKPPASLAAYECVLKGNALSWDDLEGAAEATDLFMKAIQIDPGYGLPHALLASLVGTQWQRDPSDSDETLREALRLAKRAVELDENDSTCFALLAHTLMLARSFDLALQHVRRAVEMNPNNQWNAADIGSVLIYLGQAEQALDWFMRAKEIDPYFDPPWYSRALGKAYMILHRYREALTAFDHSSTQTFESAAYMAGCYARLHEMENASGSAAKCLALNPAFSIKTYLAKQPFKIPEDAAMLAESLQLAGLPD
jgi:adenylate cyclase